MFPPGAVLEPDGVSNLLSQAASKLLGHSLGHTHGRHPAGLSAPDLPSARVPRLMEVLRELGGLAWEEMKQTDGKRCGKLNRTPSSELLY